MYKRDREGCVFLWLLQDSLPDFLDKTVSTHLLRAVSSPFAGISVTTVPRSLGCPKTRLLESDLMGTLEWTHFPLEGTAV